MRYTESLSVVVPIYNDEEVIAELLRRLTAVVEEIVNDYEIILVDDGSRDRSWAVMNEERKQRKHLRIARLSRNFGQQNAISAGLSLTTKDLIVLMDSDLQDRPEDIPVLIDALLADKEATMAIAQWNERKDSKMKIAVSFMLDKLKVNKFLNGSGYSAFSDFQAFGKVCYGNVPSRAFEQKQFFQIVFNAWR